MYWNVIFWFRCMGNRTVWNECILLLDADIPVSARFHDQCLSPVNLVRDNCLFGLWSYDNLWFQTACLGVCRWLYAYNSAGHLTNTHKHRITIENLILDIPLQTLVSEKNTPQYSQSKLPRSISRNSVESDHGCTIVLDRRDTKESTCLLRHITTEKSDLCQYAVCITRNATLKK